MPPGIASKIDNHIFVPGVWPIGSTRAVPNSNRMIMENSWVGLMAVDLDMFSGSPFSALQKRDVFSTLLLVSKKRRFY